MPDKFENTCSLIANMISANIEKNELDYSKSLLLLSEDIKTNWHRKDLLSSINEKIGTKDIQLYLLSLSAVFSATGEVECLEMITDALKLGLLSRITTSSLAFQLRVNFFQMGASRDYFKEKELNDYLADRFFRELNVKIPFIDYKDRNHKFVVIATHTLLNIKHAPTKWVFSAARILQQMGYEVLIVIEGEPMKYETISGYWIGDAYCTNYGYNFGDIKLAIGGVQTQCYQLNLNESSREELIGDIEKIYSFHPEFIWKIGGGFLMDSIWAQMTTYITLPCSNGYEACTGDLMIKCLKSDKDEEIEAYFEENGKSTMSMNFKELEFTDPEGEEKEYNRQDYNLNDDDFVITVVGNRLEDELTGEFWTIILNLINKVKNLKLLIIGEYHIDIPEAAKSNTILAGYCNPLESAIKMADLFLNPRRGGGGTAAKLSLKNRIPIVTFDDCDVAYAVGKDFVVKDAEDMITSVVRYAKDKEFYMEKAELAAAHYKECFDVDMYVEVEKVVNRAIEIGRTNGII